MKCWSLVLGLKEVKTAIYISDNEEMRKGLLKASFIYFRDEAKVEVMLSGLSDLLVSFTTPGAISKRTLFNSNNDERDEEIRT